MLAEKLDLSERLTIDFLHQLEGSGTPQRGSIGDMKTVFQQPASSASGEQSMLRTENYSSWSPDRGNQSCHSKELRRAEFWWERQSPSVEVSNGGRRRIGATDSSTVPEAGPRKRAVGGAYQLACPPCSNGMLDSSVARVAAEDVNEDSRFYFAREVFMSASDCEGEQNFFVAETARLDIFAESGVHVYARFRRFEYESLMLLRDEINAEFNEWLPVLELVSKNQATAEQLNNARSRIIEFRRQHIGLKTVGAEKEKPAHALTTLMLFCLESWPAQPDEIPKTALVQDIDEFAMMFIGSYGGGKRLLEILKKCFGV
ncbi:hypothetical protein [Eleftheria terrae]|uniref:hypothetical protein n=1 Tax=Eleftheria terrae TaxID=1597781 RepID=UPI00263A8731|nr:hypothetical protein [Eleftheria terrae]WKB56051.1 hypothetical protein N7L95_28740 [Eleftheria terrae]